MMAAHCAPAADESDQQSELAETHHAGRALRRFLTHSESKKLLQHTPHNALLRRYELQCESQNYLIDLA
jgi:hypothetical protein